MRIGAIVLSLLVLVILANQVSRLPHTFLFRSCWFFLVVQSLLVSLGLLALLRFGISSLIYFRIFYFTLSIVALAAINLAIQFLRCFPSSKFSSVLAVTTALFVTITCAGFSLGLKHVNMLATFSIIHVVSMGIFAFAGLCGLASMAFAVDYPTDAIRVFLSSYFVSLGGYGLMEAACYLRARADIISYTTLFPTLAAIALFSFLAITLNSYQKELSRQPQRDIAAIDASAAVALGSMRTAQEHK